MNAGEYRHLVSIEQPQRGDPDAYGHRAEGWQPLGQVWAKIEPFSSQEAVADKQPRWTTKYRVATREYVSGLAHNCRLVWSEKTLYIEEARDTDDRGRTGVQWQLVCVEQG